MNPQLQALLDEEELLDIQLEEAKIDKLIETAKFERQLSADNPPPVFQPENTFEMSSPTEQTMPLPYDKPVSAPVPEQMPIGAPRPELSLEPLPEGSQELMQSEIAKGPYSEKRTGLAAALFGPNKPEGLADRPLQGVAKDYDEIGKEFKKWKAEKPWAVRLPETFAEFLTKKDLKDLKEEAPSEEYVQKVSDIRPVARKNPDGSVSTVKLASVGFGGDYYVIPTIFPKDPKNPSTDFNDWIDYGNDTRKAFKEAKLRGELFEFGDDSQAAQRFAKGAWKKENLPPKNELPFPEQQLPTGPSTRSSEEANYYAREREIKGERSAIGKTAGELMNIGRSIMQPMTTGWDPETPTLDAQLGKRVHESKQELMQAARGNAPGMVEELKMVVEEFQKSPVKNLRILGTRMAEDLPIILATGKITTGVLKSLRGAKNATKARKIMINAGMKERLVDELVGEIGAAISQGYLAEQGRGGKYSGGEMVMDAAFGTLLGGPMAVWGKLSGTKFKKIQGLEHLWGKERLTPKEFDLIEKLTITDNMENNPRILEMIPIMQKLAHSPELAKPIVKFDMSEKAEWWSRERLDAAKYTDRDPGWYTVSGKTEKGKITLNETSAPSSLIEEFSHYLQGVIKEKYPELQAKLDAWSETARKAASKDGYRLPAGDELFAQVFTSKMGYADEYSKQVNNVMIPDELMDEFRRLMGETEEKISFMQRDVDADPTFIQQPGTVGPEPAVSPKGFASFIDQKHSSKKGKEAPMESAPQKVEDASPLPDEGHQSIPPGEEPPRMEDDVSPTAEDEKLYAKEFNDAPTEKEEAIYYAWVKNEKAQAAMESWEAKLERFGPEYRPILTQMANYIKLAGEKRSGKGNLLIKEHIPRKSFGLASDELADAISRDKGFTLDKDDLMEFLGSMPKKPDDVARYQLKKSKEQEYLDIMKKQGDMFEDVDKLSPAQKAIRAIERGRKEKKRARDKGTEDLPLFDGPPDDNQQSMFQLKKAEDEEGKKLDKLRIKTGVRKPAPTFYSKLEKVVADKVPNKIYPDQLMNLLQKSGVKKAEIESINLESWLADKKVIKKSDLEKYVSENKTEIEKLTKSRYTEEVDYTKYHKYSAEGGKDYQETLLTKKGKNKSYSSPHWEEENVVAHGRATLHETPTGEKVYLSNEMQSDWAAEGRQKGWISEETDAVPGITRPPDMPFKKSLDKSGGGWAGLVFKQQLRDAVDQGADYFAWQTGKEQIDRYPALSELVDDIVWTTQVTTDNRIVSLHRKGEATRKFAVNDKGVVVDVIKGGNEDRFNKEHLSSVIGNDVTKKILADRSGKLEGLELDIGGSGMLKFYDEMLPQAVNKYIKKWGEKVEQIPVTSMPKLGISSFMEDGKIQYRVMNESTNQPLSFEKFDNQYDVNNSLDSWKKLFARQFNEESSLGFKINDAMRDDVIYQGQPLFEKKPSYAPGSLQQEMDFGDIPPVPLKKQPIELQRAYVKTVKLMDKMVKQRKDLSKTQIFKSLMSTGFADLNGVSVKNINEFVAAIQVWRNPNFETFRIVYLKDDVVVGYNSFSSRMPGASLSGPKNAREALNFRAKIKWEMEKRGANGYGLVHNHQSGVVNPSLADRQVTALYDSKLPGFKWHIIINHNKYSIINRDLESDIYRIKGDVKDPYERKPRIQITRPEEMAEYAKSINTSENNIGLIFVAKEMKINGFTSIHKNIWKSKPDEFSNAVKNQAKIYGTANVVAVIPENMSESEMGKLANTGMFIDIIYDNASVVGLQREVHPNWNMPSNSDWMKLKWNQVTEPRPEYRPQLPTGEARKNLDKFMEGSVVKEDNGNPLVVYHGTGSSKNFTEFKPELTGQGNDQIGSGFYFSTNPETASAYTVSQIEKGVTKLGGEDSPGILPVYLNIKNPIVVKEGNLVNTDVNLTKNQVYKILKKSSKIMDKEESPLGDWYEEYWDVGPKDWMIRKVADEYKNSNLVSLENDFFKDNSTGFRKALSEATGYDGVKMEWDNETHYVAWFPEQIKSATGNIGAFDPENPDIRYQLKKSKLVGTKLPQRYQEHLEDISKPSQPDSKKPKIGKALEHYLTPVSTRLNRISPAIKDRVRRYIYDTMNVSNNYRKRVEPFLVKMKKLHPGDRKVLDLALKNRETKLIDEIIKSYGMKEDYDRVRKLLDSMWKEAESVGIEMGFLKDYFPRTIRDKDGLLNELRGSDNWNMFQEAINAKQKKLDRPLTEVEVVKLIDQILQGYTPGLSQKPGNIQNRAISKLDRNLDRFYYPSSESLVRYIDAITEAITARKFFGKHLQADGSQIDADLSIGAVAAEMFADNKINAQQQQELKELLAAIFRPGHAGPIASIFRNVEYIDTMGSISSAITQIQDISFAMHNAGIFNALTSYLDVLQKNIRRRGDLIKMEDLSINKIAHEFAEPSKSAKVVEAVFKSTGLTFMDRLGKETLINASFKKMKKQAMKESKSLRDKLKPIFEKETSSVIADLKAGKVSENVKYLLFNDVANMQPIALSEMPEAYIRAKNGKLLYMLKSFYIRQVDVFRKAAFADIKNAKGKKAKVEAVGRLARLAGAFFAMGVASDTIKDLVFGRDISPDALEDSAIDNIWKIMGLSKYQSWQFREKGGWEVMQKMVTPPARILETTWRDFHRWQKDDLSLETSEAIGSIPHGGKLYYWWFGGGKEKTKKRRARWAWDDLTELQKIKSQYNRIRKKNLKEAAAFYTEHRKEMALIAVGVRMKRQYNKLEVMINEAKTVKRKQELRAKQNKLVESFDARYKKLNK
ncbi:MAG: hypothetical protein R6V04_10110 [bacterium]